jgi:hypothetical protein
MRGFRRVMDSTDPSDFIWSSVVVKRETSEVLPLKCSGWVAKWARRGEARARAVVPIKAKPR